jgi:uncharacterized protein YjiS (DUF1127 family)
MFIMQESVHPIAHRVHSMAGASGIVKAVEGGLISTLCHLYHEWTSRRALRSIQCLDDCQLLDIGLIRSDIETAVAHPSANEAISKLRTVVRRVNAMLWFYAKTGARPVRAKPLPCPIP